MKKFRKKNLKWKMEGKNDDQGSVDVFPFFYPFIIKSFPAIQQNIHPAFFKNG